MTTPEVSQTLHHSQSIIKNELSTLYETIGANNELEALLLLFKLGVINRESLNISDDLYARIDSLSKRKQEVLKNLIRDGGKASSVHKVAETMKISEHTVKCYLDQIYTHLGINGKAQSALFYAILQNVSIEIPEKLRNGIVYIQEEQRPLTEADIRILDQICQGNMLNDPVDQSQLPRIKRTTLGTLERIRAVYEGLKSGIIILPPLDYKNSSNDNKELDLADPLYRHYITQLFPPIDPAGGILRIDTANIMAIQSGIPQPPRRPTSKK